MLFSKQNRCRRMARMTVNRINFAAGLFFFATPVFPQELFNDTFLLDVNQISNRSILISGFSVGGYELEDGTPVKFSDWYSPRLSDLNVLFLSEINASTAVIWGFSTGESGEKYRINAGLWLGLIRTIELDQRSSLSMSFRTLLGGTLNEHTCVGFYTIINDFAEVNCRLAASTLAPEETLRFLADESGILETTISVAYEYRF